MATPIIALDVDSSRAALELVDLLGESVTHYKVGSALFTAEGPKVVRDLRARGKSIFLDLKFHDIPNTVAQSVAAAGRLGVELLTVHVSGGLAMLQAARTAAGENGPRVLGVTVLTSFGAEEILQTWGKEVNSVREEVNRLTQLAVDAGLHGVVTSPLEIESVRRKLGPDQLIVTPGIRSSGDRAGDQVRTATPAEAARAGADYLVIGRPVVAAADPVAAMRSILAELGTGVSA
jgi:orotidine-5'-phosphate decarboxylase